jgi:hypothetical protein
MYFRPPARVFTCGRNLTDSQTALESKRMAISEKKLDSGEHRMPDYQYTAVFEPAEEGGFVVTVPAREGWRKN